MTEFFFPADIGFYPSIALIAVSAVTSFITAAAGIGGGVVLLAVMAALVPAQVIIPIHGAVQFGSNAGRTAIMLPHVQWPVLVPFVAGSILGAALGGLTVVQFSPGLLKTGLAIFILWSVWVPSFGIGGRLAGFGTGAFSSFLTMFFGATGPFVSAMVKTLRLGRLEHVATQSACMVAQHVIKIVVFGLLGFAFAPYLGLIGAMILSGFVGTVTGKRLLIKMQDAVFHKILSVLLTLLAARLFYEGISTL